MPDQLIVSIVPAMISVDPGGTSEGVLRVQNRGAVVDEFAIEVLGDAAQWTTVDRSRVPIFPGGTESVQISMQPPRASHPEAGTIPVGFRVQSTVDPAVSVVEECKVVLKPFTELAGEIVPRTARGRFSATHRLRVTNQGNAPASVSVRAEVQQGDCEVAVPPAPLELAAGEGKTATIKVRPSRSYWRGGDEMHHYRLNLQPHGGGTPVGLDAMMRQRPIARVPTALLLIAAMLLGGAYFASVRGFNPFQVGFHAPWSGTPDVAPSPNAPSPEATANSSAPAPSPSAGTKPPSQSPPASCQQAAPAVPTGVTATAGNGQATVSWAAVAAVCGPITGYKVTYTPGALTASVDGSTTTVTVGNLTNGSTYAFTVAASNAAGTGPASVSATVNLVGCVSPLTAVTLTKVANTSGYLLTWQGNAVNCAPDGPFTGTITASYLTLHCTTGSEPICSSPTIVTLNYPISGLTNTYQTGLLHAGVGFKITLNDSKGHTATASA